MVRSSASRWRRLYEALSRFERPEWRRRVIWAALLCVAPALVSGLALDDYNLLYQMEPAANGTWPGKAPFDLFRWMDPQHNHRLMDGEGYPWWTFEGASAAFLRPVASLTHSLDHWLWPHSPFAMHVHSLLWFALLLVLAARAYSEVNASRWVAGVACALFALDDTHGMQVGWIADRNALIAGVFGVGALIAHHRRTREPRMLYLGLAIACFGLSLLSAELAVGVFGYFVAYALFYERGPLGRRIASLLPYGAVLGAWALLRSVAGYGTTGLGSYLDPVREPGVFVLALLGRLGEIAASQFGGFPSDLWSVVHAKDRSALIVLAVIVTLPMIWFVWPTLRARRTARFWAAGAVLCALPISATLPSDRLLVLVGVGAAATLAQAMYDALRPANPASSVPDLSDNAPLLGERSGLRRAYLSWIVAFHFVISPMMLPAQALAIAAFGKLMQNADAELPSDARVRSQTVVVTNVPDPALLSFVPVMRSFRGAPRPAHLYWLAARHETPRIERRAPNVLRLSDQGGLFERELEQHSRNPHLVFHAGERIALSEVTIEVVALTADGRPSVCDFVFAQPLESPGYVWRTWRGGRLVPFTPPRAGEVLSSYRASLGMPAAQSL